MDTPGNQITLARAINAHRVQVVGCELFQTAHYENIARWASHRQFEEQTDPGTPYKFYPLGNIMPPHLETDYMTDVEREAALNAGVTPIMVTTGQVNIPRSITSRSQTAGGAPDYTVLDTANVTVPDWCAQDVITDFSSRYMKKPGVAFKCMDDPTDGGNVPMFTATPSIVKDDLEGKLWSWYELGLIVNPKSPVDYIGMIAASYAPYRINAQAPCPVAPGLMQMDIALYQKTG
jgi:phage tail sheath gpL-like